MFAYGQTAANAIAVMSYLATDPSRRACSREIAEARGLSQALTAKLLTQLASARLVIGRPGPGGGYKLARPLREISLLDIVSVFESTEPHSVCGFGRGWCGNGTPCPLHDTIAELLALNRRFMEDTRLAVFLHKNPSRAGDQQIGSKPDQHLGRGIEVKRSRPVDLQTLRNA